MIRRQLVVLLACLFVVMIGAGITVPVLPFYVERLALAGGGTRRSVVMHVSALTGVYAVMQLIFAPIWGRWSDRIGRRPLILAGLAGYVMAQVLFGLATSVWLLYGARILGGILSSATLPVSAAYVSDLTTDEERGRGMAWLGTATSLGFVVGPALGGALSRQDLHFTARVGHLMMDGFSVPFFAAALFGLLTLLAALRWLPESLAAPVSSAERKATRTDWRRMSRSLGPLLAIALLGQFGLAIFESTFALYAQARFNYGPSEAGVVFVVCGLAMTVVQIGAVGLLSRRISELHQVAAGFGLMGATLALLTAVSSEAGVLVTVGLLAIGTAFVSPNLSALISKRSGKVDIGAALGAQNAANSLGLASGPLIGGALFLWRVNAPYLITAGLLVVVAAAIWVTTLSVRAELPAGSTS